MLPLYLFIVYSYGEFIQDLCNVSISYLEGLILTQLSQTFPEPCRRKKATLHCALPPGAEPRQAETVAASGIQGNTDEPLAIHDVTRGPRFGSQAWPIITGEHRLSELLSEKGGSDNQKFG
jgi:hypothetical protein